MDHQEPLMGDVLDLRALELWARSHQTALEEVKRHLNERIEVPHADDATAMFLERWREVEQAIEPPKLHEVIRLSRELEEARAARFEAHERLQEWKEKKQAAQGALAKAMDLEEEESEEETRSQAPSEPAEEEKKRWRGAKKFFGKGLKKIRGKSATGNLTPPAASSPASRTPSPSRPPTPKELMVQASSDELVHAADGIQSSAEDLDRETLRCKELQQAISDRMSEHRSGALRSTQEALREGVCALEEWADAGVWELLTATSVGGDSDLEPEEVQSRPSQDSLEVLEALEASNEALSRQLPVDFLLRHMGREEGVEDAYADGEELQRLIARNEQLEQCVMEISAVSRLCRGTAALQRSAACLERTELWPLEPGPRESEELGSSSASDVASPPAAFGLREVAARSDLNPFAENSPWAEPGNPFEEPSNPFSEPEGSEAFEDAVSERGEVGAAAQEPAHFEVTESPASLTEVCAYRPALPQKPAFVDALVKSEPASGGSTPRVTSVTPGAAASMQVCPPVSPRQLQSNLAGCLVPFLAPSEKNDHLDEDTRQIVEAPSLQAALAESDAALARGRLGNGDYAEWSWRDHAAEEGHQLLRYSSHSLSDLLTEEDWSCFSYELLVLCRHLLREGPNLEQVSALIPICRVRLGINTQLHHHIVELTRPESEVHSPLDVRYRSSLLLRIWSHWESFDYGTVADPSKDWTCEWICMQLRLLRGCVAARAMQLHEEGCDDVGTCKRCFQCLRELTQIALSGAWGKPLGPERSEEMSGRRWLTELCKELEALAPGDRWSFNVVFAMRVFGSLWRCATDVEAEDGLSLDAPSVAAALLSGLHPHLAPLRLETHALLLAQQLWSAAAPAGQQLSAKALAVSESILNDFSSWLQKTPVDAAACFARQGVSESNGPLELVARRLLTVDLRDQLVQTLRDYRRHFEPAAFRPVLQLWARCYREMRCGQRVEPLEEPGKVSCLKHDAAEELLSRFGQWFVWESSSKAAESALQPFDDPPQVPPGEEAWKRLGVKIKSYLTGLTGAVQALLEELECEKSFYNEAWALQGLARQHMAVAVRAMAFAVRPRVERLQLSVWPMGVLEVPPGGGRLIQLLEQLDREANRYRDDEALREPLVDLLVPQVTSALTSSLAALDRDITSKALEGRPDDLFVPLQPPSTIFCEGVVTLWRFIHDALDAPLSLGIPVDIVTKPFMDFIAEVLPRSSDRLLRSCEQRDAFGMSIRAAQVAKQLKNTGCAIDSDQEDAGKPVEESKRGGRSRRKFFTRAERSFMEDASRNVVLDAKLLEVEPTVVATSVQQVMVRLASIGFCCGELAEVQSKLFKMINSGDDDGCPTARHNEARMLICEELPELQDSLLYRGQTLARYLAARLVYQELRSELFEKLYFKPPLTGGGTPTPASGSITPGAGTMSSAVDSVPMTLKDVVLSRQNSFLSLIEQTPTILLVSFVGELGIELTNAWLYVIVDYLRRQKLEQLSDCLESDQEALSRTIESMMQMTRRRVQATALGGLTHDDCRDVEKRLEEVQRLSQCLIEEIQSRTVEELARYAAKVRGDLLEEPARERSQTPPPGPKKPRSASPVVLHGASRSPRGQSPLADSPTTDGHKRSAKQLFQQAWKATKRLGKSHKDHAA